MVNLPCFVVALSRGFSNPRSNLVRHDSPSTGGGKSASTNARRGVRDGILAEAPAVVKSHDLLTKSDFVSMFLRFGDVITVWIKYGYVFKICKYII
jgi:hypothetical protein